MVNRVCTAAELVRRRLKRQRRLRECAGVDPPGKEVHPLRLNVDLRTGLAFEIESYNRTVVTEDRLEGVRAFGEKRKTAFKGK